MSGRKLSKYTVSGALAKMLADIGQAELRAYAYCGELNAALTQSCDAVSLLDLTVAEKARFENIINELKSRYEQKTAIISEISRSQVLSLETETRVLIKEKKFEKAMAHISESSRKQLKALKEIDDISTKACIAKSMDLLESAENRIKREKTLLQQKQAGSQTPNGTAREHGGSAEEAGTAAQPGGGAAIKPSGMDETLSKIEEMLTYCREVCSSIPEAVKEKGKTSIDSRLRQLDSALAALSDPSDAKALQRSVMHFRDRLDTIMLDVSLKPNRMKALIAQYEALRNELEISPQPQSPASPEGGAAGAAKTASPLDIGGIDMYDEDRLKNHIEALSGIRRKRREQAYIQETIDALLESADCSLIGKSKEPAFMQQRLFKFRGSSSVKITLAPDGVKSMELIGLTHGEREPTQEEREALRSDMESFCELYAGIEKQLPMLGIRANLLEKEAAGIEHARLEDIGGYELTAEAREENCIIDNIKKTSSTPQTEALKHRYLG